MVRLRGAPQAGIVALQGSYAAPIDGSAKEGRCPKGQWNAIYHVRGRSGPAGRVVLPVVGWTLDDPDRPAGYVVNEEQQLCRADSPEAGRPSGAEFMGYQSAAETIAEWLTDVASPDRLPLVRVELVTGRQFPPTLPSPQRRPHQRTCWPFGR